MNTMDTESESDLHSCSIILQDAACWKQFLAGYLMLLDLLLKTASIHLKYFLFFLVTLCSFHPPYSSKDSSESSDPSQRIPLPPVPAHSHFLSVDVLQTLMNALVCLLPGSPAPDFRGVSSCGTLSLSQEQIMQPLFTLSISFLYVVNGPFSCSVATGKRRYWSTCKMAESGP